MSDEKLPVHVVRDIVETEGLGYAIQAYLSHTEISDTKLASMWKRCADLLTAIEEYINDEDILAGEATTGGYDDGDEDDYE